MFNNNNNMLSLRFIVCYYDFILLFLYSTKIFALRYEPPHEETSKLNIRKQRHR